MPPFQVVFAVGNSGMRPTPPSDCPPLIARLMKNCWAEDPDARPSFDKVVAVLHAAKLEAVEIASTAPLAYESGSDSLQSASHSVERRSADTIQ